MKSLRFAYSLTFAAALVASLGAGSCGGLATTYGGLPDATVDAPPTTGCATDLDCASQIPPTNPADCAMAACDRLDGTCVFSAKDEDGDGHPAADCASTNGVTVVDGDDCNDHDPNLYPDHPEACSSLEDGGTVTFPLGMPAGICRFGLVSCLSGGGTSPCLGAVGPAARDCASVADNDCDGRPDATECNCSIVPAPVTESCFPCPYPQRPGAGACVTGSETCQPFNGEGMTTWGPCTGYVCATSDDTCEPGNDDNCDGIPNDPAGGCACFDGMVQYCFIGPGCIGIQLCGDGRWGSCSGTCPPRDAGGDVTPTDAGECTASCKRDRDCRIECGTATVYCCDVETNTCFAPPSGICVHRILDGGPDVSPY